MWIPDETMASKGQITIPKDAREALGFTPGTRVTFTRTADGDFVISASKPSLMSLRGRLAHIGPTVSLDEMDVAQACRVSGCSSVASFDRRAGRALNFRTPARIRR